MSRQRKIPGILLGLTLLLAVAFGSTAQAQQEDGQAIADRIAVFTARAIYNLDTDHLLTSLEPYLEERPAIRALVVTETIDEEVLLTYFRQGDRAVYGEPIPEDLRQLDRFTAFSTFEGEKIGRIEVYHERVASFLLTEEEKAWLADNPEIPVGIDGNWPPIDFFDENGEHSGILNDYLDLFEQRLGVKFRRVPGTDFKDILARVMDGRLPMAGSVAYTEERAENLFYVEQFVGNASSIFVKQGSTITSSKDLKDQRVAVPKGFVTAELLAKRYPDLIQVEVPSVLDALRAVSYGNAEVYIGSHAVGVWLLRRNQLTDVIPVASDAMEAKPNYIVVHKNDPSLIPLRSILSKVMESIDADQIAAIERRWFGVEGPASPTATVALTAEEQAWIAANPKIRVHNETNWPPFNFAEDGEPRGLSIDYMNLLAERVGLQVDYVTGPSWHDFMEMMKSGDLDVMLNIVKTQDRQKFLLFTPPYADNPNSIVSRRGAIYENIEQLIGKTVSLPKGFFFEEILKRDFPQIRLNLVTDVLDAMKEVSFGRADAAFGELAVVNYLLGEHLMTDLVVSGEVDLGDKELSQLNIAARKELPLLASILTKGVNSFTVAEKRALREKWIQVGAGMQKAVPRVVLTPEESAWLETHRTLRLGVDPAWPPYDFVDDEGRHSGFSADILAIIGKSLGVRFALQPGLTWKDVLNGVENRTVDIVSVCTPTPERKEYMLFSRPVFKAPWVIASRKDMPSIQGLGSLYNKRVLVAEGYAVISQLRRDHPDLSFSEAPTPLDALRMVSAGQADAYIGYLGAIDHLISAETLFNLHIAAPTGFPAVELAICMRSDWPELVGLVNKALRAIPSSELKELANRWIAKPSQIDLGTAPAPEESSQTLLTFITLSIGLLGIFGLVALVLSRVRTQKDLSTFFGATGFRITILAGLSILVAMVAVMNWLAVVDSKARTAETIDRELQIVLNSSIDRLRAWIRDREAFLQQLGRDPELAEITRRLLDVGRTPDALIGSQALADARRFFDSNPQFGPVGFFIIAPDRISVGSRRDANVGSRNFIADVRPELIDRAFRGEAVFVPPIRSDVQISEAAAATDTTPLTMFFAAPITDESGSVIAVLTERVLPEGALSDNLRLSRVGETGETYAVNAEAKMVSESRFKDDLARIGLTAPTEEGLVDIDVRDPGGDLTAGSVTDRPVAERPLTHMMTDVLRLRDVGLGHTFEDEAARRSTTHSSNVAGYADYRGVEVVGAWAWLDELGLGLATELDHAEAYADFFKFRLNLAVISGITTLLAIGATLFTLLVGQRSHRALSRARDELEDRVVERTQELRDSEHKIRRIFDTANEGIWIIDLETKSTEVNEAMCDILGQPAEGILGRSIFDFVNDRNRQVFLNQIDRRKRGETGAYEIELSRPDRSQVPCLFNATPLVDDSGERIGSFAMVTDITGRKEAERKLADAYNVISGSIDYATNIQRSILPDMRVLGEFTSDHFVIWEPRDRVGGDIYWCRPWGLGMLVIVADCTGHGVPGAFMTLIANAALDRATETGVPGRVGQLISRMHQLVQVALKQHQAGGDSDDGLELGACYLDPEQARMVFSGARFSLFVNDADGVRELKGDKSGIGYRGIPLNQPFTDHKVDLVSGAQYYMTTDGLIDQIGGQGRRSFGKKRFKALLGEVPSLSMAQQKARIERAFSDYRGQEPRRDDVSVIGFRIR